MKRESDNPGLVFGFVMVPVTLLAFVVFVIPGWSDEVLIAVLPSYLLNCWVFDQLPRHITDAFGFTTFFVLSAFASFQYIGYALVVASALRRDRLRITLILLVLFHAVAVAVAAGLFLSWGFDMTPPGGSLSVLY